MPSIKDQILEIIEASEDKDDAINNILVGDRSILRYCVVIAIDHLGARHRAVKRRELRRVIQPQYVPVTGPKAVTGRVAFSKKTVKAIQENKDRLFSEWKINATTSLGEATKEQLLAQIVAEHASAKGHIRASQFYEALVEPMQDGQTVADCWDSKDVQKLKDRIWDKTEPQQPYLG